MRAKQLMLGAAAADACFPYLEKGVKCSHSTAQIKINIKFNKIKIFEALTCSLSVRL